MDSSLDTTEKPGPSPKNEKITHAFVAFRRSYNERKIVPIGFIKAFCLDFDPVSEYFVKDIVEDLSIKQDEDDVICSDDENDFYPAQIIKIGTEESIQLWLSKLKNSRITVPPVKHFVEYPPKKVTASKREATADRTAHSPSKISKTIKTEAKKRMKHKVEAKKSSVEANMQRVLEDAKQNQLKSLEVPSVRKKDKTPVTAEKNIESYKCENIVLKAENKNLQEQITLLKDSVLAHKLNAKILQDNNFELREALRNLRAATCIPAGGMEYKRSETRLNASPDEAVSEYSSAYYSNPSTSKEYLYGKTQSKSQHASKSAARTSPCLDEASDQSSGHDYDDYGIIMEKRHLEEPTSYSHDEDSVSKTHCISGNIGTQPSEKSTTLKQTRDFLGPIDDSGDEECGMTDARLKQRNASTQKVSVDDENRDFEEWLVNKYPKKSYGSKSQSVEPKLLARTGNKVYVGFDKFLSIKSWSQIRASKTQRKFVGNLTIGLLGEDAHLYNKTGFKGNDRKKSSKGKDKKEFPAEVVAIVRDFLWRYLMKTNGHNGDVVNALLKTVDYITIMSDAARDRNPERRRKRAEAQKKRQERLKEEDIEAEEDMVIDTSSDEN